MSVKVHEGFCLDSARRRFHFDDHFLGDSLRDLWAAVIDGAGDADVIDQQDGGIVRLLTGNVTDNDVILLWDRRILLVSKKVTAEWRVKISTTSNINVSLRLQFDGTGYLMFRFDPVNSGDTNWMIIARDTGTTSGDSGVAPDADYHIFRIEAHTHGANHVHFYIDGTETNNSPLTVVANIPTDHLDPWSWIRTEADVAISMDIDYIVIRQDR